MTDFQLWDLDKETFQNLVYNICKKILGIGTVNFTSGPDGGKDAKFEGTAEMFPSKSAPWKGKFIIQAKGCKRSEGSCSDYDFLREIEKEEIPKIKKLIKNKELDNYIIFTNRKLSGKKEEKITSTIKKKAKPKNVWLVGREYINDFLSSNPDIVKTCKIDRFLTPIRITPHDLRELINGFEKCRATIGKSISRKISKKDFTKKTIKNRLNKLSKEYFEYMKEESLPYFVEIDNFLSDPKNKELEKRYIDVADEIKSKITIKRKEYNKFEEILEDIYDKVTSECPEISQKKMVHVFLHYMYWNCNIGRTK